MKPRLLCCTLALLLTAPLLAAPPAPTPRPTMVLQVGPNGGITAIALSPDGHTLATSDGVKIRLWDLASGQLKMTLPGPPSVVAGVLEFSPDGRSLATAASPNVTRPPWTVQLWDLANGYLKATLPNAGWPYFSPDGRALATADDSTVRVWDVASGQLTAILPNGGSPYFSPDSKTLATKVGADVRWWDVGSGQLKATLKEAGFPMDFSPDGKSQATLSDDGTVRLWDAASGQLKWTLTKISLSNRAFSPDSKTLAIASPGGVRLWDVASGQLTVTLPDAGWELDFSPDSKTLATAISDTGPYTGPYTVQLWDVASGQLKATLSDAKALFAYYPFAFSTDGQTLATRDDSGQLQLWDVAAASPVTITAQTSLAPFPPWLTHPFSTDGPAVSLLDPVDEHVLATLQALADPDWITSTPDGYFEGSANLAAFVRWNVDGVLYPAAAYWDVYYRPDLVQQALKIPGQ
jgi:WD40 repeat protein